MKKTFEGFFAFDVNYQTHVDTPDGPMHEDKGLQILARDVESAIDYARALEEPINVEIKAVMMVANGDTIHLADTDGAMNGFAP